jgi:hypothetical protein
LATQVDLCNLRARGTRPRFSWKESDVAQSKLVQKAYTAVVEHFIETGRAPHYTELAQTLGIQPVEARDVQRQAAEASLACWFVQDADYVESWAPFSNVPTHYLVTVEGEQRWYGQ